MRRAVVLLAALAALGLSSCDMMFETNLFKDITHDDLAASDLATASPAEIEDYLASDEYKNQISEDPALQLAIVYNLEAQLPANDSNADAAGQQAAITLASVLLQTSPAAQVSVGLYGSLPDLLSEADSGTLDETAISDAFIAALPSDIGSALNSLSPTPPASFVEMISSFAGAAGAYIALGADIDDGGSVEYAFPVPEGQKLDIAINGAISVFVSSVKLEGGGEPVDTQELAEALWQALLHPDTASLYISVDTAALTDALTAGPPPGELNNLLFAAGISIQ